MNLHWELVLHEKAVRTFIACRGAERRRLERVIDLLAQNPTRRADGQFKDRDGRVNYIIRSGNWTAVYWIDAFVREVRIVSLEKVG
jgi:hypothetical protein